MISIKHKFLFVHIPKTGGNSIQQVLKDFSEDDIVCVNHIQDGVERFEVRNSKYNITKHSTYSDYSSIIEPDIFSQLFKVATIRNPWDRAISFYFSPHRGDVTWDRASFSQFLLNVPPVSFYVNDISDLDFVIRFENIQQDFDTLMEKLNLPKLSLPHRNKSKSKHYSEYYDEELIQIAATHFKDDIALGNYTFG